MSALTEDRRLDDLDLQLKGLVHARALLEMRGASPSELETYATAADRVRTELAQLEAARAPAQEE